MTKFPKAPEEQVHPLEKSAMLAGERAMKRLIEEIRQRQEKAQKCTSTSTAAEDTVKEEASRRLPGRPQPEEKD